MVVISSVLTERLLEIIKKSNDIEFQFNVRRILNAEGLEDLNYLDVARDNFNMISYLDKKRMGLYSGSQCWEPDNRIMAKIGKIIKRLVPDLDDKFVTSFSAIYTNENKICDECIDISIVKMFKGEDIRKNYLYSNYASQGHSEEGNNSDLTYSCMRYEEAQDWLDIYVLNTAQVSLACIMTTTNKVKARCIIWHKDEKNYYDRIYALSNEINREMQACLEKMGMINISEKNIISGDSDRLGRITLNVGEEELDSFPYMDSMDYIIGKCLNSYGDGKQLHETDGGLDVQNDLRCDHCDDTDIDSTWVVDAGRGEGMVVCEACITFSAYSQNYLLQDAAIDSTYDGWIQRVHARTLMNGEICHVDTAVELYNRKYINETEHFLTTVDGEHFLEDDCNFVEINKAYYNTDSDKIELIGLEWQVRQDEIFIKGQTSEIYVF